jgi:hypothetical protein
MVDVPNEERMIQIYFSVVGWTSLLYKPSVYSRQESLKIEKEGFRCFLQTELNVARNMRRPITENLNGFTIALPGNERVVDQYGTAESFGTLEGTLLNAALFDPFGIKIIWTSCLTAHLTFDKSKRRLHLFGLPAFCILHTRNERSVTSMYVLTTRTILTFFALY